MRTIHGLVVESYPLDLSILLSGGNERTLIHLVAASEQC